MMTMLMAAHAVISVLLIITVLLQFGKGAEVGILEVGPAMRSLPGPKKEISSPR